MKRREFITLLGGAAAAWPVASWAQPERMRRIAWLSTNTENDLLSQGHSAAFREGLAKLGWIEGRNLHIDFRWGDDFNRLGAHAAELVSLAPEVIVTSGGAATRAVQPQTHAIPIVFTAAGDPVSDGLVRNIARPEGNITGFSSREPSIAAKFLELLKEAAPRLTRVAVIFNPELTSVASRYIASIEAAALAFRAQVIKTPVRNAIDIVRAIDAFATKPNGGLLVLPPSPITAIRDMILELAAQYRLPAIYPNLADVTAGGLLAYATDRVDQFRRAATYVDRLLRGAKVDDLPVQFPTKYELVINLKTAKAIGLDIPSFLLQRADEIIE